MGVRRGAGGAAATSAMAFIVQMVARGACWSSVWTTTARLGRRLGPRQGVSPHCAAGRGGTVRMVATSSSEASAQPKESGDAASPVVSMEELVALCKRRGFIFPSSEIYNGFAGFYDYGPLGVELKNNVKQLWWRDVVRSRDDIEGLDSSIVGSPKIWLASGHVDGFSDPMVDCRESKLRYRADQLFAARVEAEDGELLGYVSLLEGPDIVAEAEAAADRLKRKAGKQGALKLPLQLRDLTELAPEEIPLVPSPATGKPGSLTAPRAFNLMFQTSVGAMTDASSVAYLRPETAQGIFTNFKNVQQSARAKLPFGIAQIGKDFRNEITPRNFIFRSREFEQMEVEYFIDDDEESWRQHHQDWIDFSWAWLKSVGLREELMGKDIHAADKLAHYARACTDITFRFPFGQSELQGVAARGAFDLTQHQDASGKSMEYFDEATKRKFLPHVIEPSIGVDRLVLALLTSAYHADEVDGEARTLLRFSPAIAPIKCAVFPLLKNKPEIVATARGLYETLRRRYNVFWDVSGAIGRRYRRMDEAGTPFCVTVDFDTLEDGTVTVRDRDTTQQRRMPLADVAAFLTSQVDGY